MKGKVFVVALLLCVANIAHAEPTVWYVHPDSVQNCIQDCLDACADNDVVLVGPGTYTENIVWPNTYGIHLISELGSALTIIDGSNPTNPDSASVIAFVSGQDTTSVVYGFTIENGTGTYDPTWGHLGGGIYCLNSSPTLTNNLIQMNSADWAAGIACEDNSNPIISNNTITGNTAIEASGGIECVFAAAPRILGNTITGNSAEYAGGISCDSLSQPIITGNTISGNNAAINGGGIGCYNNASPTITGNTITGNTAGQSGGGIYSDHCSLTVADNAISNNTSTSGSGGGIICRYSSSTITDNTITGNVANYGGGIGFYRYTEATITDNIITDNTANLTGGGIDCWMYSEGTISHNTITGNTATLYGAGINCMRYSSPIIDSCSIANNNGDGVFSDTGSTPEIHHCNIHGNTDYGVQNLDTTVIIDAEDNWWGDASGPSGFGPGTGDLVSQWVDYDPWLTDSVEGVGVDEFELENEAITHLLVYPNPFSKLITIRCEIQDAGYTIQDLSLQIYDITGRLVRQLDYQTMQQSNHITWDGTDDANRHLPSGIYFLKLQSGDYNATEKLLLIR